MLNYDCLLQKLITRYAKNVTLGIAAKNYFDSCLTMYLFYDCSNFWTNHDIVARKQKTMEAHYVS